jgi:LmbE family N-acetylglucosaminyl deacetylase
MQIPVPDLLAARRLVCVQPHYDDNDIGAGGTLARLAEAGAEIHYVTVTDDLAGVLDPDLPDEDATRRLRDEQRAAAAHVGVAEQHWLGYPDAGDYDYFALRRDLIRLLRRLRPDFVLACDPWLPYEAHRDHVTCGRATADAVCLQGLPRICTDPETDRDWQPHAITALALYWSAAPNTSVDVSAHRERKHRALDCYRAQFRDDDLRLLHAALEAQERAWAEGTDFAFAERFKVLRPFQLHCNVNAVGG